MQESETRFAAGNLGFALCVRVFLHRGGCGADRHTALGHAEQCSSGGECAGGHWAENHRPLGDSGRADGNDFFYSGFSDWTGARVVRDVARRIVAEGIFARASEISHAGYCNVGSRTLCRGVRGDIRHRHAGEPDEYRDAVRVYSGVAGSADFAEAAAGKAEGVPRAVVAVDSDCVGDFLLRADGEPDGGKLGAIFRLDDGRSGVLFRVRTQTQRTCGTAGAGDCCASAEIMRPERIFGVALIFLALLLALWPVVVFGWGENADRLVVNNAVATLPQEMRPFFEANRQYL